MPFTTKEVKLPTLVKDDAVTFADKVDPVKPDAGVFEAVDAVVAVAAFPPMFNADAVPVMFVPTKALGVPNEGVTKVGLFAKTTDPVPVDDVNVGGLAALPVPVEV